MRWALLPRSCKVSRNDKLLWVRQSACGLLPLVRAKHPFKVPLKQSKCKFSLIFKNLRLLYSPLSTLGTLLWLNNAQHLLLHCNEHSWLHSVQRGNKF